MHEVEKSIENILDAIEKGVFTKSTKERLEKLELRKQELETEIAEENFNQPTITREQLTYWFENLKRLNPEKTADKRRLVDTFINSIIVHDDRIDFYFNFKKGAKTLTRADLDKLSVFDLSSPPKNNRNFDTSCGYFLFMV